MTNLHWRMDFYHASRFIIVYQVIAGTLIKRKKFNYSGMAESYFLNHLAEKREIPSLTKSTYNPINKVTRLYFTGPLVPMLT